MIDELNEKDMYKKRFFKFTEKEINEVNNKKVRRVFVIINAMKVFQYV